MTLQQLDKLIERLTIESRDLAIQEILSVINNSDLKKQKLTYWLLNEKAKTLKKDGLNNATDLEIALLEAFYRKLC